MEMLDYLYKNSAQYLVGQMNERNFAVGNKERNVKKKEKCERGKEGQTRTLDTHEK